MSEKEYPSVDCIPYGQELNVEHTDGHHDVVHREGGISYWQGMVFNIVKDIDFQHCYDVVHA